MLIMQSVQFCIGCIVSAVNESDVVTEVGVVGVVTVTSQCSWWLVGEVSVIIQSL